MLGQPLVYPAHTLEQALGCIQHMRWMGRQVGLKKDAQTK
jgi:hypothetical protein